MQPYVHATLCRYLAVSLRMTETGVRSGIAMTGSDVWLSFAYRRIVISYCAGHISWTARWAYPA